MTFAGVVGSDGHIILDHIEEFRAFRETMKGQRVQLTLELMPVLPDKLRKYYYSAIVQPLADYSGHTLRETHLGLKRRFLTVDGEPTPSITQLSPQQLRDFIDHCLVYLAELHIAVVTE